MKITNVIVHDVPKHKKDDATKKVEYSEKESVLTEDLKLFFKDKITEAIVGRGFKVCFDDSTNSPVPNHVKLLNSSNGNDIIQSSKDISKHLFDIQTGWNPPGIVVIIKGEINSNNILAILKLERDEGARLKKNLKSHFIDIEQVKDLMLTKKTRLYKVGLFFERQRFKTDFDGYVTDNQIEYESSVARFFLELFLGCYLYEDGRNQTKRFFEISREFISRIEDPVDKATYYEHLLSYTNKQTKTINPKTFASEYLRETDRDKYETFLNQNDFDLAMFEKDTELIKSHITKMMIDFENDISIISRNGEIGSKVKLSNVGEGNVKAEVVSKIKRVSS